jgi:phosphate/sulfate permease
MTLLIIIIILALIFDFINGFHDAANSIATVVSTKVLTPFQAVVWAALFNFLAFFIFKDHGVANTVAKTVHKEFITLPVIISGLIGSIVWNLITWWKGIPSSSSHTLIGGFAGAAIAHAGFDSVDQSVIIKTASFIVLAPLIGMLIAFVTSVWFLNSFRKGALPKLISVVIMSLVAWLVYSELDFHPEKSKIKAEAKQEEINGAKHDVISVNIYDVSADELERNWTNTLKEHKAGITGPGVATGFQLDDKTPPLNVYWKSEQKAEDKAALSVGFVNDSVWMDAKTDTVKYKAAAKFLTDFAASSTAKGKMYAGKIILAKENFKWILLAFILFVMGIFTLWLSSLNNSKSTAWFKRLQLLSSAAFSIGHGGNDAQKVMGIITAALIASGKIGSFEEMPNWVPLACYTAIAAGTMSGGWKIVKTMGTRITKVTPFEGVAAETAGAVTLFLAENLKIPVSTTHTIAGSIMGVGATKRLSAVRWGVTVNLLWAWILTIPVTGILSAVIYWIFMAFS